MGLWTVKNTKRRQLNYKILRFNRRNLTLSIGKMIDEEKQRGTEWICLGAWGAFSWKENDMTWADQLATQSKDIDDVEEWLEEITIPYFSDFVWVVEKQDEAIKKLSSNLWWEIYLELNQQIFYLHHLLQG